ncbi:uncharacterized protein LOC130716080 isoform X2 [Lotus japonicus]|uniref:uncharacterized protein LOC130716080 isoform X2 n=1 Tax=Lotus japonicus TaxID=34305 RepID=UPI002587CE3C|nr:uncharacterized protein LOC130716080 isoform X2 [Lotus japonicus]
MDEEVDQPLRLPDYVGPIQDMGKVLVTVTGYHGLERFNLIKLIAYAGASYSGRMAEFINHLVCFKFEGRKYEIARRLKIPIVNHRWIEDCLRERTRLPVDSYMLQSGHEVGPLSLRVPETFGPKQWLIQSTNLNSEPFGPVLEDSEILLIYEERPGKGKRTICSDSGVSIAAGKSCKERRTDTLNTKDGAISCLSGGVTIDYLPDNSSSGPDDGIFNKKRSTTGGSDENELIKSTTLFVEDTPLVPQTSIDRSSRAEKSKDCDQTSMGEILTYPLCMTNIVIQKIEHAATTDQKLCSLTIPCYNLASGTLVPMDQELPDSNPIVREHSGIHHHHHENQLREPAH